MINLENEANDFIDQLDKIMPDTISDHDKVYLMFNLLLVKFNERPSMLVDSQLTTDQLLDLNLFMSFIKEDPDLSFKILQTELDREELWIINIQNKPLFINQSDNKHENRSAGYFEEAYTQESLFVQMFINDVKVYAYVCPISLQNEIDAVKKWHRFNIYARLVGWYLRLNLSINFL